MRTEPFQMGEQQSPALFHLKDWTDSGSIACGFSTKVGGVSSGEWDSLNCGMHVNDKLEDVVRNRSLLSQAVGFSLEAWTCAEQVHGTRVAVVTAKDKGRGNVQLDSAIAQSDALITNSPGILLTSFYADCVPLYVYDPVHQAVALAHAGWKGTAGKIAGATVKAMQDAYGSRPEQLLAAIGPSIGACCYEVSEEVASRFPVGVVSVEATNAGKYRLDLKENNENQFRAAGLLPENILRSAYCTSCEERWFYSHRRDRGRTGRMASWIGIRVK